MAKSPSIFERLPSVWFLLGLLFNAAGLYLGFEFSLSFGYMVVGWFCCAYGLALFFFRMRERPRGTEATRMSPKFIADGADVMTQMAARKHDTTANG